MMRRVFRMSWGCLVAAFLLSGIPSLPAREPSAPETITPELRDEALRALRDTLATATLWPKVHAAEYLLTLDYPEGVTEVFTEELKRSGNEPKYRIGIWRVLAQAAVTEKDRKAWIGKIREVFLDSKAPDRLHAVETLAKLHYEIPKSKAKEEEEEQQEEEVFEAAAGAAGPIAAYARWAQLNSGVADGEDRLAELLDSDDVDVRAAAAYALRWQRSISPETLKRLAAATKREPDDSAAKVSLLSAAWVHAPEDVAAPLRAKLLDRGMKGTEADRVETCHALAVRGDVDDLPLLIGALGEGPIDVRATAALAISRMERRERRAMTPLDWAVIGAYALGMLAVGWYYGRRKMTTEDYLLGGRTMRPTAVGLSLFATLLSTISYLAWPGEMIQNGPMMMSVMLAYPVIFVGIGYLIIPPIMKLRVTSAYELLETRFGLSVRMLGSVFFLAMRLLWMAVIVYATTSKVLVPLLGISTAWTPVVCAVMGLITVAYTSSGGLRAVVFTDVIQTAILFGGAIVTLVVITVSLGGVGAWWPSHWAPQWEAPVWGFDSTARVTFAGAVLAQFIWYICTSSSDQMAIQRYLATRDAPAARRVVFISLLADVTVSVFLCILGLALFAYFRQHPYFMPDGYSIIHDADKLFPQFIVIGLPAGLSGLVVAGLLAAAMSSLSAGINSSCSVITVDFIDRFRRRGPGAGDTHHVKLAKYISLLVGVLVVVLSGFVGVVQGNLLEIAYKVVNLLTVPLSGLFFMALFVRWATTLGTLVGAACGLAVAIAINYWEQIFGTQGISFLYAMPLALVTQMAVGMVVSLIPIGRKNMIV